MGAGEGYDYMLVEQWANNEDVRKALQIRKGPKGEFLRCNKSLLYKSDLQSVVDYHHNLSDTNLQCLVFCADLDLGIPHIGTQAWIKSLNLKIKDPWRAWFVDGQVAGMEEVPEHRRWMYNRINPSTKWVTEEFEQGVDEFLAYVHQSPYSQKWGELRCPCVKCKSRYYLKFDEVKVHLYKKGFMPDYYVWTSHGETRGENHRSMSPIPGGSHSPQEAFENHQNQYETMVMDAAGPSFWDNFNEDAEEMPNSNAREFYDMLHAAQQRLWEGCEESQLSTTLQLLSIKATTNMSQQAFNLVSQLMRRTQPKDTLMLPDLYQTKKLVSKLGLDYKKIDCCVNGCMLYYKDDTDATQCKFCCEDRYSASKSSGRKRKVARKQLFFLPLIPRLQRLFASQKTAKEMRWHYENRRASNVLSHPSDGEAWKVLDRTYPDFAYDPRNVRLGLCSDGFTPFGQCGKQYSCWPVIVTPYNLPPEICMTREYMFLTLIIPGPNNPKGKIDVYLQPLIDELKLLWDVGVSTYDASLRQNFSIRAALLWTINDFPAYGMLSGWMTMGRLSCPICMEKSKSFQLKHGRKTCFFDCHRQFLPRYHQFRKDDSAFFKNRIERSAPPPRLSGEEVWERVKYLPKVSEYGKAMPIEGYNDTHHWTKQSIFWELAYWKTNLIRHNLDVMHIEKNVFENLFHTVMDTKGKTKDNAQARMDVKEYCRRPNDELVEIRGRMVKPIAKYTLNLEQKRHICQWVKKLKLPDGYASNLS